MPVKTQRRGGRYRVIEAESGRIAKNQAGSALDGGGHPDMETAQRQARAVNRSLSRRGNSR